jgi:hypothetical protein
VVVHDFNIECIILLPSETNPPSVIDAYRILAGSVSFELLKTVGGRYPQIFKADGTMQHAQFAQGRP